MHVLAEALDLGEAEVIALAIERGGFESVLLDDRDARRVARERGLAVAGSAGVLVLAKDRGVLPEVRPTLDQLRSASLYLSDAAYLEALAAAGEVPFQAGS